jgi:hypothetical protein
MHWLAILRGFLQLMDIILPVPVRALYHFEDVILCLASGESGHVSMCIYQVVEQPKMLDPLEKPMAAVSGMTRYVGFSSAGTSLEL